MSNNYKRRAETQLTSDNCENYDRYGDEEFITEPSYASAEEMSKRRILHVKRNTTTSDKVTSTINNGSSKNDNVENQNNPFQFLNAKMPAKATEVAETVAPVPFSSFSFPSSDSSTTATATTSAANTTFQPFSFADATNNSANPFVAKFPFPSTTKPSETLQQQQHESSTSTSSSSSSLLSSSLFCPSNNVYNTESKTNSSTTPNTEQEYTKPAFTFNFGNIPETRDNKRTRAEQQNFSEPASTELESLPQKQTETTSENGNANAKTDKDATTNLTKTLTTSSLFGGGAFNFKGAVNSFVEARKKMEEKNTLSANMTTNNNVVTESNHKNDIAKLQSHSTNNNDDELNDESNNMPKTEVIGVGELVISVPVKLYCFVKGSNAQGGEWVERGVGDAKIKRVEKITDTKSTSLTEKSVNEHDDKYTNGQGSEQAAVGKNVSTTVNVLDSANNNNNIICNSDNKNNHNNNNNNHNNNNSNYSLNVNNYVYRFLVRDGYSLNVTIGYKTQIINKQEQKHIVFTVNTNDGLHTYLLKFTGSNAESNCAKFVAELNRINEKPF